MSWSRSATSERLLIEHSLAIPSSVGRRPALTGNIRHAMGTVVRNILGSGCVVALMLVTGCSGSDDSSDGLREQLDDVQQQIQDSPTCDEMFADGVEVDAVVAQYEKANVCRPTENPDLPAILPPLQSVPCEQSSDEVFYVDFGWGVDGELWQDEPPTDGVLDGSVC